MKSIKYIVYKEDKYYVSQCLNVDISSFGLTIDEATSNLTEALELYFEDEPADRGVWARLYYLFFNLVAHRIFKNITTRNRIRPWKKHWRLSRPA